MHETLNNRTYVGKKMYFNFLGTNFPAATSAHRGEKQPVLGPGEINLLNQKTKITAIQMI